MLSILGSLLGFAGSAVPAVTQAFQTRADNKQELAKMRLMAELRSEGMDFDMKMFQAQADDKEHERLIEHDIAINNSTGFTSILQKSVRPVITYAFFGLFATIEITLLMSALEAGTEFSEAIQLLWDDDTKAIFAAIISFWFGSRALEKHMARKK
ncbi:MAG: hypothetical protein CBB72_011805 [Muricauda sp. TMED12]|nr:MAG: hypothetical protein CBB72_011805 [Muricauda sp. TMED12]